MSNSVLDHLGESDQSETDSMVRMGEEMPKGKRIHLRDVLTAVAQESPVKADQSEHGNETQINSRKRRMPAELLRLQDTEEYQDASKAVKSSSSGGERGKRPPRRAAVIAREHVNFLHGNIQHGLELRENRKSAEKAARIVQREIETDSETESESEVEKSPSIEQMIDENDDLFENKPKERGKEHAPGIVRTFGKKGKTTAPPPLVKGESAPPAKPLAPPPGVTVASIQSGIRMPTAKIARKKIPNTKVIPREQGNGATPPPPPLKRAPKQESKDQKPEKPARKEKENKPDKDAKEAKLEKKSKSESASDPPKPDRQQQTNKQSESAFDYQRVEKIKKMFNAWVLERRQREQN